MTSNYCIVYSLSLYIILVSIIRRFYSQSCPQLVNEHLWHITKGKDLLFNFKAGLTDTAIYEDGQFSPGPELTETGPAILPSGVQLNKDEVLVFNGFDVYQKSEAAIFNFQTSSWTDVGPSPAQTYHTRGILIQGSDGEDIVFISGNEPIHNSPFQPEKELSAFKWILTILPSNLLDKVQMGPM